jgi:hypothetical protein
MKPHALPPRHTYLGNQPIIPVSGHDTLLHTAHFQLPLIRQTNKPPYSNAPAHWQPPLPGVHKSSLLMAANAMKPMREFSTSVHRLTRAAPVKHKKRGIERSMHGKSGGVGAGVPVGFK